jgi:hypothetical protein
VVAGACEVEEAAVGVERVGTEERRRFNDDRRRQFERGARPIAFVCECGDPDCHTSVPLRPDEYDRKRPGAIVDPAHALPAAAAAATLLPLRAAVSASLSPEVRALQTMEKVLAGLRHDCEGDEALARLAAAIERDRAELLAAVIGSQTVSRLPQRVRNPVLDG